MVRAKKYLVHDKFAILGLKMAHPHNSREQF